MRKRRPTMAVPTPGLKYRSLPREARAILAMDGRPMLNSHADDLHGCDGSAGVLFHRRLPNFLADPCRARKNAGATRGRAPLERPDHTNVSWFNHGLLTNSTSP